jgi:hypothetical protein
MVQVQICQPEETVKYVSNRFGIRKLAKLTFNNRVISKIEGIFNNIAISELKISQTIHAVKNYRLSKLDYVMSNSVMSITKLS